YNMSLTADPNFIPGTGTDSSFYDLQIVDHTQEAYATISVYDLAGNKTTITSRYLPKWITVDSSFENYGVGFFQDKICKDITLINSGKVPFSFKSIALSLGNQGFTIDSIVDTSAIPIGGKRIVKVCLIPKTIANVTDTLVISDGCVNYKAVLVGSGGQPDFTLSDHDFKCVNIGATKTDTAVLASNTSKISIRIDSVVIDDPLHFSFPSMNLLPFLISEGGTTTFLFSFTPDKVGNFTTLVHIHSVELGWRQATLTGCGQIPASVNAGSYTTSLSQGSSEYAAISLKLDRGDGLAILPPVPNPATAGSKSIRFVYGLRSDSPLDLSIYDILGNPIGSVVHSENLNAGIYEADFPIGSNLPSGSYIYRLAGAGKILSGRWVIAR
ncbi:MAG: T9SS type A sorting domain-containing protein, partial [Candidatus Kapaibacterium sp.]